MTIKTVLILLAACSFLSAIPCAQHEADEPYLSINCDNAGRLPRNFRTAAPLDGVPLNASASGQFSVNGLTTLLLELPEGPIWIVDLREESHGFADGTAISWRTLRNWANIGRSLKEIVRDEQQRLQQLFADEETIEYVMTEEQLAHQRGLNYLRLPITDHCRPTNAQVDNFLAFYRQLQPKDWVHYHCNAGKGRASMLMVMHDIMRNGDSFSFEEILLRQGSLGGKDYSLPIAPDSWKLPYHRQRLQFLRDFYTFRRDAECTELLWTEWLELDRNAEYSL